MRILLDTCVISELQKPNCTPSVKKLIREYAQDNIFISVITIGEITKGIALLDDGARKTSLLTWLNGLEESYADNIIKTDAETARIWGELTAKAQRKGRQVSASDGLIAATALQHGLHVITRNINDFEPTDALLINPWNV